MMGLTLGITEPTCKQLLTLNKTTSLRTQLSQQQQKRKEIPFIIHLYIPLSLYIYSNKFIYKSETD